MTSVDYAALAARALRRGAAEGRNRPIAGSRDVGIGVVAQSIATRQRRRGRRRALGMAVPLAAAAGAAVYVGYYAGHDAGPSRNAPESSCRPGVSCTQRAGRDDTGKVAGRSFLPGQLLVARAGAPKVIEFATGTRITLEQDSTLEYRQGANIRRFGLERGAVHLHVAKLARGQRFLVETPDSEVEVRGTVFNVAIVDELARCRDTRTLVSVEEGVVDVRTGGKLRRLTAGQSWPERCPAPLLADASHATAADHAVSARVRSQKVPAPLLSSRRADLPQASEPERRVPAEPVASPERALPVPSSALAEQNDLFARASRAQRQGRTRAALAQYDELLARFPAGPLTEAAVVERLRVLRAIDTERARSEARAYLDRYPGGFARREAVDIVQGR
jgi:hypothetical protein